MAACPQMKPLPARRAAASPVSLAVVETVRSRSACATRSGSSHRCHVGLGIADQFTASMASRDTPTFCRVGATPQPGSWRLAMSPELGKLVSPGPGFRLTCGQGRWCPWWAAARLVATCGCGGCCVPLLRMISPVAFLLVRVACRRVCPRSHPQTLLLIDQRAGDSGYRMRGRYPPCGFVGGR